MYFFARNSLSSPFIFLIFLLFLFVGAEECSLPPEDLSQYLPQSGEAEKWVRDCISQEYKGEDLYLYIDGGAEIYHEYGFRQVIIQDYKSVSGKNISLEIFEMEDDKAAFGIYTFKRSAEGKRVDLGNEGQIEDYYLNFWKGNFLVTLTGFDEEEETVEGLVELAKVVDAKIESKGITPALLSLLPEKGLIKKSVKYFRRHLGIYNIHKFFTKDVFKIHEGIRGSYRGDYEVFIFSYKHSEESQKRFNEAKEKFAQSPGYRKSGEVEDVFKIMDSHGQHIFIKSFREYIFIVLGAKKEDIAKEVLINIQDNLIRKTRKR